MYCDSMNNYIKTVPFVEQVAGFFNGNGAEVGKSGVVILKEER